MEMILLQSKKLVQYCRQCTYILSSKELLEIPAEQQFRLILTQEGDRSLETTKKLVPHTSSLQMSLRLPVLEMIQSSLTTLSPPQYQQFRQTIEALVQLDNQTSLFEFIVRHHLLMHLDRRFSIKPPPRIKFHETSQIKLEIELMLSAFASASASGSILQKTEPPTQELIEESYRLAMQVAGFGDAQANQASLQAWEVSQLELAMAALQQEVKDFVKNFASIVPQIFCSYRKELIRSKRFCPLLQHWLVETNS